jgi:hypothetical protein
MGLRNDSRKNQSYIKNTFQALFKKSPEEMYLEAAPQKDDFT